MTVFRIREKFLQSRRNSFYQFINQGKRVFQALETTVYMHACSRIP